MSNKIELLSEKDINEMEILNTERPHPHFLAAAQDFVPRAIETIKYYAKRSREQVDELNRLVNEIERLEDEIALKNKGV